MPRTFPQSFAPETLSREVIGDYYIAMRKAWMSHASRYVGRDNATDAVQSAFVRMLESADTYRPSHPLHHWAGTIVTNACRDMLRRGKIRRAESIDATTETGDTLASLLPGGEGVASEANDSVLRLREIVDSLPEESQEVIRLFMAGRSEAEIADTLGIPAGTVKSRLFKARQRVRDAWEG